MMRVFLILGVLWAPLLLSGCGEQTTLNPTQPTINTEVPKTSQGRALVTSGQISGFIEIPELDLRIDLDVGNEIATGSLPSEINQGAYTLRLTFELDSQEFGRHVIATTERELVIGPGLNKVILESQDYHFPDEDKDQYSNFTELVFGYSPSSVDEHPQPARAFVTSVFGAADLSTWPDASGYAGLEAGDSICQLRAAEAGLSGQWVAWLSDSANDAYCRVAGFSGSKADNCGQQTLPTQAGPWVRMDGYPFAPVLSELTGELKHYAPIMFDEFGIQFGDLNNWNNFSVGYYWTGTSPAGLSMTADVEMALGGAECSDWSSGNAELTTSVGQVFGSSVSWTYTPLSSCAQGSNEGSLGNRLLCLEINHHEPLQEFRAEGKRAFITSERGIGNLSQWESVKDSGLSGVDAGDAVCQRLAASSSLNNAAKFKAFLSDDETPAPDRFDSDGPWYRPDGVLVMSSKNHMLLDDNATDFLNGVLNVGAFSTLSVNERGEHLTDYGLSNYVWTGTHRGEDGRSQYNCDNWTSESEESYGTDTTGILASMGWLSSEATSVNYCSASSALYCFEDD